MKSSCNEKDSVFNFSIPEFTSDGEFPIIAVLNDTYGQSSTFPVKLDVMNYPPEVEIVNKEKIEKSVFVQNETVIITYRIRDNNTDDSSKVYIAIYNNNSSKTDNNEPYIILETSKYWTEYNYSFEIPSNFSDGEYTFDIYLVDKNGKKSKISNALLKIDFSKAQDGSVNLFLIEVERKWIIIVVVSVIVMIVLLIVLIIIILLIPCGEKEKQEMEEIGEEPEDWPSASDSGETVSIDSDEIVEYNAQP
ncbi:Bap-like [Trichomonas vaginalis G3]|uniref:Bap-like n=1 Tax=Trichomonas vaginalis (strain ATCC PRA-98 / G3) TaxID=412133 RepID=A2DGB2_TRIV3|nr:protein of unknown function (DUF4625) family [Trichomonas vaginalis G3]EAY20508.1 Bap-like [Trichomonas vaginalis G3]KAI5488316.1 protein of unknown function (DUF4625) family [Trichomonas vaginalis G3]|eukprot:XP_001581494.1 Bap-like [Trichomonas vaginalis G3]